MKKVSIILLLLITMTLTSCKEHTHKFKDEVCYCGEYEEIYCTINYDTTTSINDFIDFRPSWYEENKEYYIINGTKTVYIHFEYGGDKLGPEVRYLFSFEASGLDMPDDDDIIIIDPSTNGSGSDEENMDPSYSTEIPGNVIIIDGNIDNEELRKEFDELYKASYDSQSYSLLINENCLLDHVKGNELIDYLNYLGEEQILEPYCYPFDGNYYFEIKIECHYDYPKDFFENVKFFKPDYDDSSSLLDKFFGKTITGKYASFASSLRVDLETYQLD